MASDQQCAVPDCDARTLRTYCIRCEINGPAAEHEKRKLDAKLEAVPDGG